MEAWTIARVSPAARRMWLQMRGDYRTFRPYSRGYRMIGWQSEIDMARAMGRGAASAKGQTPHLYDM